MGVNVGRPARSGGFTLLEIIVVLILMAMAVGIALPFLGGGLDSIRDMAGVRSVAAFLGDARLRAMNGARPVEVSFDSEAGALRQKIGAEEKSRYQLPRGLKVTAFGDESGEREPGSGVIRFYPLGDSGGGSVMLEGPQGNRFKITVGVLLSQPVTVRLKD